MFQESHAHASSGFPSGVPGGAVDPLARGLGRPPRPLPAPPAARLTVRWELGQPLSDKKRLLEAEAGPGTQDCSGPSVTLRLPSMLILIVEGGSALLFPLVASLSRDWANPCKPSLG